MPLIICHQTDTGRCRDDIPSLCLFGGTRPASGYSGQAKAGRAPENQFPAVALRNLPLQRRQPTMVSGVSAVEAVSPATSVTVAETIPDQMLPPVPEPSSPAGGEALHAMQPVL